jgi:hypothetical protein
MGTRSIAISDEAYLRLKGLKRVGERFSDVIVRIGSNANPRTTLIRRFCIVIWGYCLAVWLYVIAFQLRYPDSVYDTLVWWLPIRMDYLGEVAFVLSFMFALIIASYRVAER